MKTFILTSIIAMFSFSSKAQTEIVRIADIEVYPQYLEEYIKAGREIAATSIKEESGVICLFPCRLKENGVHFRILEIYASPEAYRHHIHTKHFLRYKQETAKMVKSLKLNDLNPLDVGNMTRLFERMANNTPQNTPNPAMKQE